MNRDMKPEQGHKKYGPFGEAVAPGLARPDDHQREEAGDEGAHPEHHPDAQGRPDVAVGDAGHVQPVEHRGVGGEAGGEGDAEASPEPAEAVSEEPSETRE